MSDTSSLILAGSIAFDRIMVYPGKFADIIQPDKLHVLSVSVLLSDLQESRGGVSANIAYTLALLGEKPILYGAVGDNARAYMAALTELGVQTQHVYYSKLATATFTVMTDQADCQVGGFYPGAMSDAEQLSLAPFKDHQPLVVISPHDPAQMARQVAEAQELGLRLVYDIGQQVSNVSVADLKAGLAAAEVLIVNDYEMGVLEQRTGLSATDIISRLKVCVITLGEKGSEVYVAGQAQPIAIPVVPVSKVVDPTGAGDAFRAGFLYGYLRGWSPSKAAQLGATTAAYAVEKMGTQNHTFTREAVADRFTATFQADLW